MASPRSQARRQAPVQSAPPSPSQRRPSFVPYNSGRSGLRSAEEQLRDIREGDTSWQLPTSNGVDKLNGDARDVAQGGELDIAADLPKVRVYLHQVRKTDTMPLILLAYEISATALKKANRLWSTDSIQSRKELYLPVDECGVKAEQCPPLNIENTKVDNVQTEDPPELSGFVRGQDVGWPLQLEDSGVESSSDEAQEQEWVSIPGIGRIQVISIPPHKLSYFPTIRRNTMERSSSLPTLESLAIQDRPPRDSMDSVASRSSIGSLVEDGVGRLVRYWHDNQGRKKWAKIGKDLIEL